MALSGSCQTGTWQGSQYSGSLVFYWTATQNASNNTSTISWNITANVSGGGWIQYSELSVSIDGTSAYYRDASNHTSCKNGTVLASGTKTLTHNANGTRSFSVSIGAGIYNWAINETGSGSFTLNTITSYTLSTSVGSGSSLTVNRTSSGYGPTGNLSNGARLYSGDKLKITFTASSGYAISTHTVNGSVFTSGGTYTVSGNVSVVASALYAYTLTISAGTGSSVTVNRTSSLCAGTGNLSNNAKVYNGDQLKITFTASTNYSIQTHTVNGSTFTSGNTYTSSGNVSVVATAQALSSTVKATNANIGSVSTITVTKNNSTYYHSLQYTFGNLSGYITSSGSVSSSEVKFSGTSVSFTVPTTFYAQITSAKSGTCTIKCRTYSSSSSTTVIGSIESCTFTATAKESDCKPTVTATVTDSNTTTIALTGNSSTLVKYKSTAVCAATVTAKNSATISSVKVNGESTTKSGNVYSKTISGVSTNSFSIVATDSRGYQTTLSKTATMIDYVLLTCNPTIKRTTPTSNTVSVTLKGNYFRGSFGAISNTLSVRYRYKESSSVSWSAWTTISSGITYGSSSYTVSTSVTINDAYSYQKAYDFQVSVRDGQCTVSGTTTYLTSVSKTVTLSRGTPVFDWGQNDFNINVPLNVEGDITIRGDRVRPPQYKQITLSNVAITTRSNGGAYYYVGETFSSLGISGIIIGLVIVAWSGAASIFYPTVSQGAVGFISDISQTVSSITLRIVYIE